MFRDRRTGAAALATAALLVGLEAADAAIETGPEDDQRDDGTTARYAAVTAIAITTSLASLSTTRRRPIPQRPRRWWAGLALVWSGAALNRWARASLGTNYRSQLTVVAGHDVTTSGPYAYVRHPMYTGASTIAAGCALAVDAPAAYAAWALPVAALVHRISVEEAMLADALGDHYAEFCAGRARLVPRLW